MASADELKALGNKAIAEKNFDEAVAKFTEAIALQPENHILYSNRSAAYASKKDWQKALDDANKTTEIKPDWPKGWGRKGTAYYGLGDLLAANDAYEEGLKVDPNNAGLKKDLAAVQKAMKAEAGGDAGDPGLGLGNMFNDPQLLQKLAANPKTSSFLSDPSFMAKLQQMKENPKASPDLFSDPRMLQVLGVLMGVDMQMGMPDEMPGGSKDTEMPDAPAPQSKPAAPKKAPTPEPEPEPEELDEEALEKKKAKEAADKEKALGTENYKKRNFDQAIEHYTKAWELHKDITYLNNLGAAYFEKGDYEKAIEACTKAVEEGRAIYADFKMIAKSYARIGTAYEKQGNLDLAIENYKKSLTEHRTPDVNAKLRAAERTKTEQSRLAYIDPAKAEEAREEGNKKFKESDWPGAVAAYSEMIKRAPDDPRGYSNRAAAFVKLLEFPSAVEDCNTAIKKDATFIRAYIRKAQAFFGMREYSKCVDACTEAAKVDLEHHKGANAREIEQQQQKAFNAMYSARENETEDQTRERLAKDPEIMSIMQDPIMQSILQQAQSDPAALTEHMKNPEIRSKIQKLVAAGVIRVEVIATSPPDPPSPALHLIASLPSVLRYVDEDNRTVLHHAARLGRSEIVRAAISTAGPDAVVDPLDADRCTPLHLASRNGHIEVVTTLLAAGADVRAEESFDETPLHEAARNGHAEIAREMKRGQQQRRRKSSYVSRMPEKPVKRWLHLPANNVAWVMDLVQRVCAMDHRTDAECNRIMAFIEETFHEMRTGEFYRRPHFKMEAAAAAVEEAVGLGVGPPTPPIAQPTATTPGGRMFSMVLPIIDVDIDEGTKNSLRNVQIGDEARLMRPLEMVAGNDRRVVVPQGAAGGGTQRRHPLTAMPTNLQHYLFPHLAHFDAMAKLRASFTKSEYHVPRPLDQSYHEALSAADLALRNESQVLFRYLRRVEGRLEEQQQQVEEEVCPPPLAEDAQGQGKSPFERHVQRTFSRQASSKQKKTDGTKAELGRMAGRQDQASSVQAKISREKRRMDTERRKQILCVAQLWVWRIDENTIITAFPDRWDNKNAKTLLNEIKHRVLGIRDLRSEDTDMMRIVESILESALGYSEEEFHFQFEGPKSYCTVFASSIAHVSNEAMKRYAEFKASIKKMGTSKTVLDDLRAEIELLQEIDDIREEINMIKRVLRSQERVYEEFRGSEIGEKCGDGKDAARKAFKHPTLDFFKRLEEDANRVRDSITTLLDLRQREANIEEALSASEQSKILFIFTGATVVFAPLSWATGIFEVSIEGLASPTTAGTLIIACVLSLFGTLLLIALSLQIYEFITQGKAKQLNQRIWQFLEIRKKTEKIIIITACCGYCIE
ncbi:Heat shock protein sti1-like protein [Colletotrichum sp. SAR 10_86]|nr:Heat shock protein sti1-like protein [Colletotrichum sp. SAR 10_86]